MCHASVTSSDRRRITFLRARLIDATCTCMAVTAGPADTDVSQAVISEGESMANEDDNRHPSLCVYCFQNCSLHTVCVCVCVCVCVWVCVAMCSDGKQPQQFARIQRSQGSLFLVLFFENHETMCSRVSVHYHVHTWLSFLCVGCTLVWMAHSLLVCISRVCVCVCE